MQVATVGRQPLGRSRRARFAAKAWLAALAAAALALPGRALADEGCAAAYEGTQVARKAGGLLEAQRQALVCSQAACPKAMVSECTAWLGEIERALPSVVLAFEMPDGSDVIGAQVTLDGAASNAAGQAIPLDPGAHSVRVTLDGFAPLEQRFVLKEGEQRRRIGGKLSPRAAPQATPSRLPAFVVGGVAVAAFGVAIGAGASAVSDFNELSKRCEPGCPRAEVAGVRAKAIVADVALGVGAASLVVAAVLFFRPAPATTVSAGATASGGFLRLERTF